MTTRHLHLVTGDDLDLAERTATFVDRYSVDDSYARTMAIAHAPITVHCTFCKAIPGGACQAKNRYVYAGGFHAPRRRAVAHLTDEQKIAAVAAMRARQEQTRDKPMPPLTAEQQATRNFWSATFKRINAEVSAEYSEKRRRCFRPYVHSSDCTCAADFFEEQR